MREFGFRFQRTASRMGYGLWVFGYPNQSKVQFAKIKNGEFSWTETNELEMIPSEPTLFLPLNSIKDLAIGLIESGHLSRELLSNEAELKATRSHLDDMRRIAFHEVGIHQ